VSHAAGAIAEEELFLAAYDEAAAELCDRVRRAYEGPVAWHDRIWAIGWAAMRFLREDPARARLLVVQANGGTRRALTRRDRLLEGLAELLDAGRGELGASASASPCTAEIVAGSIYTMLLAKVGGGCIERGEDFLPELVYMATMPYLGTRVAEGELSVQPLR
jgi:AcrR family transcriptional regulator